MTWSDIERVKRTSEKLEPVVKRKGNLRGFILRLRNDDFIDEVSIKTIPRFKSSELSGDEWRTHAQVELRRKGHVIATTGVLNMECAAALLPWFLKTFGEDRNFDKQVQEAMDRDWDLCQQPGCPESVDTMFKVLVEACHLGPHPVDPDRTPMFRGFCKAHLNRGDQSFEDSNESYEEVDPLQKAASHRGLVTLLPSPAQVAALAESDEG